MDLTGYFLCELAYRGKVSVKLNRHNDVEVVFTQDGTDHSTNQENVQEQLRSLYEHALERERHTLERRKE